MIKENEFWDFVSNQHKLASLLDTLFPPTGDNLSSLPKAVDRERLTALAARKEALLEKLSDKMDELKKLCIQEAVSVLSLVP